MCPTEDPPHGVPDSRPELLELHGVDEGVDGGVGVAEPEHKACPARREGKLEEIKCFLNVQFLKPLLF